MTDKDRFQRSRARKAVSILFITLACLLWFSGAPASLTQADDVAYGADSAAWAGAAHEAFSTRPFFAVSLPDDDARSDLCDWSGQSYEDFYLPPDLGELTAERLGELLRVEHLGSYTPEYVADLADLTSSPYGAELYRVLYLSQTPLGVAQAVSGYMAVPTGTVPADGFPVISHGHGTTGLADICAPTRDEPEFSEANHLLPWVAYGYLVSATDYVGLGPPGLHPYLVGEAAAYSMLDGARAALRFCDDAHGINAPPTTNKIVVEGHSQGGHAALFAHQEWESYAPELNVLGTVAFAPASESRFLAQRMAGSWITPLVEWGALSMYAYGEYYPDGPDPGAWLLEPYATDLPVVIESKCAAAIGLWLGFDPGDVFQSELLDAMWEERWDDIQPWTDYFDINTPGNYASEVPVLLLHGERDNIVPPEASQLLKDRLCGQGTPTKLSYYDIGHLGIASEARPEAAQWMADRLAGLPAPNGCLIKMVYLPLIQR